MTAPKPPDSNICGCGVHKALHPKPGCFIDYFNKPSQPLSGAAPAMVCSKCHHPINDISGLCTDAKCICCCEPAAPVAVPAEPKCDVCQQIPCACEISEDDYEYGEPHAKSITPAQKKLAEKLDRPPLPPPQEPHKCTARLSVEGQRLTCELYNGATHHCPHEARLEIEPRHFIRVQWEHGRVVSPKAVGI